jgi:hypothetical protein
MVLFGAVFGWALLSGGEKKPQKDPDQNPEVGP